MINFAIIIYCYYCCNFIFVDIIIIAIVIAVITIIFVAIIIIVIIDVVIIIVVIIIVASVSSLTTNPQSKTHLGIHSVYIDLDMFME